MDDTLKTYTIDSTASRVFVVDSLLSHLPEIKSYLIKFYPL